MATILTISEVAELTGLTPHTLRYYERVGLIAPVLRAVGGQRRYAASDLEWIRFLLRLRETRMPIGQMQRFARLRAEGDSSVSERRQMLEAHLAAVQASIATMQGAALALQGKIEIYRTPVSSLQAASTPLKENRHDIGTLPTRPRQAERD